MADLSSIGRRKLERLLRMGGGYVLDFFAEVLEVDIVKANVCSQEWNLLLKWGICDSDMAGLAAVGLPNRR